MGPANCRPNKRSAWRMRHPTSAWRTCQAETFRGRHEEPTDQVRIPNQRSARRMSHESTSAIRMHLWLPYGDFERFNHEYLTTKVGAPAALLPPLTSMCVLCVTTWLGSGCGRRLVTGSCVIRET